MEFQTHKKRRCSDQLIKDNSIIISMIDKSTMTDCYKPMNLNMWTQTDIEKANCTNYTTENELRNKIVKLEEKLKSHTLLLNELISQSTNNKDDKNDFITSTSFKYKIVAEGPDSDIQLEPVIIESTDSDIQLEPVIVESTCNERVVFYENKITDANITEINDNSEKYPTLFSSLRHYRCQKSNDLKDVYNINSKTKCFNWNENSVTASPITSSSCNVKIDNQNKSLACVAGTSTEFPNIFNNFRPISNKQKQQQADIDSIEPINSEILLDQIIQSNDQVNAASSISDVSDLSDKRMMPVSNQAEIFDEIKTESTTNTTDCITEEENQNSNKKHFKLLKTSKITNNVCYEQDFVRIGPNNTQIPLHIYENIDWTSTALATRKLLTALFDRSTLATHSLTGKPSPAFHGREKPLKKQLDPKIVSDIIFVVTRKCNVAEREVRSAITTKCADENKMLRQRERKQQNEFDKENIDV